MIKAAIPVLIGTLFLAGCGGSGSSCGTGEFCDVSQDLNDTLTDAGLSDRSDVDSPLNETPTDFNDLPTSGVSVYAGQIALQVDQEGELVIGNTDIEVAFTSTGGSMTGTATGFVGESTGAYTGELAIEDGTIFLGSDAFLTAVDAAVGADFPVANEPTENEDIAGIVTDISGTLTASTMAETTFDGNIIGAFSGDDADIVGLTVGTTVTDETPGNFVGVLVAVQ